MKVYRRKNLLSVKEAAEYLHVSSAQIYYFIKNTPGFPAYRIGSNYRIRIEELNEWIETNKVTVDTNEEGTQ